MDPLVNKHKYGNYTTMPTREDGFPLDQECLSMNQNNIRLLAVLASLAGSNYVILAGCGKAGARTPGYVYIRQGNDLVGEILYYDGSNPSSSIMHFVNIDEDVEANTVQYNKAYTERYLAGGPSADGTGQISWSAFSSLTLARLNDSLSTLTSQLSNIDTTINRVVSGAVPVGTIIAYGGSAVPPGWLRCDGSLYTTSSYPDLALTLGKGGRYFTVPDLRGRCLVGYDASDTSYNAVGLSGGERSQSFKLEITQMPRHAHTFVGDDMLDAFQNVNQQGPFAYDASSDKSKKAKQFWTGKSGGWTNNATGEDLWDPISFSIMQPYYVVNYIIRY